MSYKYSYRGKTYVKNMVSDSLGTIGLTRVGLKYRDIVFDIKHKGQTASFGEFYAYIYYPEESDYATDHSFLFTDRSIYRPGQTVFFKGIVMMQRNGKSEVQPGVPVNVTLYDANRDDVATQEFTTNEFGSVHGEFILPSSGLTGQFFLEIDGRKIDLEDRTYFSVEEYKRPTFEANFEPVKKTFRVDDSVIVHGSAVAYAGSKITGAKVVYRVVRRANFPYWYGWWRPQMRSEPQEIAHGETITDENGKFEIEFKAVPDESISKETLPVFNYEITADITDINGETRSTTSIVKVGYHTMNIGLTVDSKLNKTLKTNELTLSTENLNGEFVPAEGTVHIYKLKAPESVVRPRPWPAPDYQEFSREEFKTLFPHEAYKNEDDPEKWENGELVFEVGFNTEKSKKIALGKTKKWKSGAYKIELKSIDPYGQEILVEERTFLFSPKDSILADNKLFSIKTDKAEYKPGETAKITLASAAENLTVTVLVEKDHQIVQTFLVQLNNGKESLCIPVTEPDLGGFGVFYSYAAFNSFAEGNLTVSVPFPSSELQIETLSLRDKLKPGEEETWSFHIKGPNGKKVSAELLAGMYDASLDQFKPHQWNFQPIFQNTYEPGIWINARRSFDLGYFRVYEPKSSKLHFPQQNYDQLNWFGFNFGNYRLFQREYLQKKYTEVEPNMVGSFKADIPDGFVQGTVYERLSGMPLAGVNIVIDGTMTGTQTDFDGEFSLKAKSGDALVFSYIAYDDFIVNIGKDNYYEIRMAASSAELEQVVVTAFGIERELSGNTSGIQTEITLRGNASISKNPGALIIIDGKVGTMEEFSKLDPKAIESVEVLDIEQGKILYGAKAKNGVIVVTTKKGTNFENVQIRKNLRETAFFFPELKTDEDGNVSFHFTTPEALTTWKLQLLAHTKNLQSATLIKEAITQKELMVLPNFPRFLRVGDSIQLSTKIANLTEKTLMGNAVLKLYDAISGAEISSSLILSEDNLKTFSVKPKGNTTVHWKLHIPENLQAIRYKIIAKSGNFGDGMQAFLPVLSNRILVSETMPMWVRSNQSKTFTLEKLKNNVSQTLKHHRLTLEITSNPAWYAVQALPYLMEYPYECNEQTFSRYFANALASHVVNSNPRIKEVFQKWKNSDALISNLEKNEELKSLLIRETPWIRDAESETEQKKRIALLFDLNKMSSELKAAKTKLQQNQLSSGAWPWFDGGRGSRFITQYIIAGFGHLKKLGVEVPTDERMIRKAIEYLDGKFLEEYRRITRFDENADLNKYHLTHSQIHYLYMRSFFPEIDKSTEVEEISDYYYSQMKKYWLAGSLYEKGLMSLVLYRNGAIDAAKSILNSLKETSVVSDELGRYWKENKPSWFWYEAPIETQSLIIEVFSEIEANFETIDGLKIWLLKNKQTNRWSSTKSTAWAVYSLLLQGSDWLGNSEMVQVEIAGKPLSESISENVEYEAGTGYFKTTWSLNEIVPEMATVKMEKKGEGIAWGALYWQYFEDMDKITPAETPLKLHKKLFLKTNTDTGEILTEIGPESKVKIGDLIRIRIELKVDRPMEFLHLKDMRASGLEPVNVLSEYKWQDGLGYYESTKDASTNFFFDSVGKGIYVFEYDLRASNSGNFGNGITTIQCMYAPEFSSHSEGSRIKIQP
ncbi:MAG TPA: MG2 domain-containing protein [Flavobacteriaceae bacterium]|nr:MG2 domain-containing protein [Flavobacteriaceae bacterium]